MILRSRFLLFSMAILYFNKSIVQIADERYFEWMPNASPTDIGFRPNRVVLKKVLNDLVLGLLVRLRSHRRGVARLVTGRCTRQGKSQLDLLRRTAYLARVSGEGSISPIAC